MSDETYHRVYASIWREPWTEDQLHLALYLLTCEHRKFEGIYRLPLAYACEDLSWPRAKVRSNLQQLEDAGFARYDDVAQIVWVVKALKRQKPNANQAKSAARKVLALPTTTLLEPFLEACRTLCPILSKAFEEEAAKGSSHSKLPSFQASKLQGEGARERADNLADELADELAVLVVAGTPSPDELEDLRSFAAYAVSQGVHDAQLLARAAKDPRPASLAANAALIVRDAQTNGQTVAWANLASAVVAGDTDPVATERWTSHLDDLKAAVGNELFDVWLAPLTALTIDGDELVLGGPGATVAWVEDRFRRVLADTVGPVRLIPVLEEPAAA